MSRPRIALLSNPKSTGNIAQLSRIRDYCADHPDLFHYEVERADQIGEALRTIARVRPKMLIINGGDGTVQAALTEIHNGGHFEEAPPPVAVLPNGKTNLIALDLGAHGDPIRALERLVNLAQSDLSPHIVERELIADYPDPAMGSFPMHHVVPRLSGTPGSVRTPAPRLGEHNRAVLARIGVDEVRYSELLASGAVCEGTEGEKGP